MKRIYDAAFGIYGNTNHLHLERFWWVEGQQTGTWTREEAFQYVANHPRGEVYVQSPGTSAATVLAYEHTGSRWIQTVSDGVSGNNLVTLAQRHSAGIVNR